jgi:chromate transporter
MAAYFLHLGACGFGGPIALAARMQRDWVERRSWITDSEYLEGLAFAQLAPGPLAAQLAMYLGYLYRGIAGASVAGLSFVLPSFLMVLALAVAYVRYGALAWVQNSFYAVGPCVIGVIAIAAYT